MKIRIGFVSNSSCVSFAIFGVHVTDVTRDEENEMEEKAEEAGLDTHCDHVDYDFGYYIGISAENMPRDKTLNEIEQELLEKFGKLGIAGKKIEWQIDGWEDR